MAELKDVNKMTAAELEAEHSRLDLEEKKLRVEDLRMRVENERARRDAILRAHKQQQESLDDFNRMVMRQQSICRHRKGGKNLEGILNGQDFNYSVVKNVYPWGELQVICSRCGKEWKDPAIHNKELRKKDPKEFARLATEYKAACDFPTDNETSGNVMFVIQQGAPAPAQA